MPCSTWCSPTLRPCVPESPSPSSSSSLAAVSISDLVASESPCLPCAHHVASPTLLSCFPPPHCLSITIPCRRRIFFFTSGHRHAIAPIILRSPRAALRDPLTAAVSMFTIFSARRLCFTEVAAHPSRPSAIVVVTVASPTFSSHHRQQKDLHSPRNPFLTSSATPARLSAIAATYLSTAGTSRVLLSL